MVFSVHLFRTFPAQKVDQRWTVQRGRPVAKRVARLPNRDVTANQECNGQIRGPREKVRTWSAFSGPCPDFFRGSTDPTVTPLIGRYTPIRKAGHPFRYGPTTLDGPPLVRLLRRKSPKKVDRKNHCPDMVRKKRTMCGPFLRSPPA